MVISGPLTPGQVSFLLGIIPVCVAWLYSEFLEYKKTAASLKTGRDSDISLVELGNDTVKEDDRAVLLEGGGLQSASPRSHSSSIASPVVRLFTMDESFLLENRLTLRAISEFGIILFYFYLCDRTNFFGDSKKSYNRDLFLFLYFLLIIVSAITSFKIHHDKSPFSGKAILYLNRHQTEEWKGWMQVLFLMYHYFAATEIYNAIRIFIAACLDDWVWQLLLLLHPQRFQPCKVCSGQDRNRQEQGFLSHVWHDLKRNRQELDGDKMEHACSIKIGGTRWNTMEQRNNDQNAHFTPPSLLLLLRFCNLSSRIDSSRFVNRFHHRFTLIF